MPSISVLMPVRNAAPYLDDSLASLWRQTDPDFEVVAVDDGSSDESLARLERAARREPRLRVVSQPARGIPAALNAALERARGRWIARHDADDRSHPERFARQREWLRAHPDASVVGCRVGLLPRGFRGQGMRRWVEWHNQLLTHQAMAREALVDSPLLHGTAMARRSAIEAVSGWREGDWPEDVDLWLRLLESGHRFGKVPRVLYGWRQHPASATRRDPRYRQAAFDTLRLDALRRGPLRGVSEPLLIGVGVSLERWRARLLASGFRPRPIALGRPARDRLPMPAEPTVLVFGAPHARQRWRAMLRACGWTEGIDFVFVA